MTCSDGGAAAPRVHVACNGRWRCVVRGRDGVLQVLRDSWRRVAAPVMSSSILSHLWSPLSVTFYMEVKEEHEREPVVLCGALWSSEYSSFSGSEQV